MKQAGCSEFGNALRQMFLMSLFYSFLQLLVVICVLLTFGTGFIPPFAGSVLASAVSIKSFHKDGMNGRVEEKVETKVSGQTGCSYLSARGQHC